MAGATLLLVLLAPCTDWFITFTRHGQGDRARAIAVTPLHLLLMPAGRRHYFTPHRAR